MPLHFCTAELMQLLVSHRSGAGHREAYKTLSHEIGSLGLLERENAAALNAALRPLAAPVIPAGVAGVKRAGVRAPHLLTSNDGPLLSAEQALRVSGLWGGLQSPCPAQASL